uniref:Tumor protein p53 inducible protein 13 n=1 Tax=Latimeria chalumnae TaxID=7897 RepID=H3B257_LATCH
MNEAIVYNETIPNSGPHRPKWAKYGEYIYLPPQRWIHNLEHGGFAFLYHPCVHQSLKEDLSLLARACLYKHVITAYGRLSQERPLALVTFGKTLEMSRVKLSEVVDWLRNNEHNKTHARRKKTLWISPHPTPPHPLLTLACIGGLSYTFFFSSLTPPPTHTHTHTRSKKDSSEAKRFTLGSKRRPRNLRSTKAAENEAPGRGNSSTAKSSAPGKENGSGSAKCTCQNGGNAAANTSGSSHAHQAAAQKGAAVEGQLSQDRHPALGKGREGYIPTPRTEEAVWAAAALTFLFVVLTLSVLYTRLYRKFRKSESLYWAPEHHLDGHNSVADIIKRRLMGKGRRKKVNSYRKRKTVLYENLSEDSNSE